MPVGRGGFSTLRARRVKYGLIRWLLVPLALTSFAVVPALATQRNTLPLQPSPPIPRSCSIGVYVDAVYNFSPTTNSFEARMWVWSVCPDSSKNPLDTLEFTNANTTTTHQKESTTESNGVQYSNMLVTGKFRHQFDVRRYPFDRQVLQIVVENGNDPVEFEVYTADNAESGCAPNMGQDSLAVRSCSIKAGVHHYATSFGSPGEANGSGSGYSEVTVDIEMTRNGTLALFLKSTSVYFAAFLMAFFSLVIFQRGEWNTPRRLNILGVALFSTALWMFNETSVLNSSSQFTLLDAQGILTLVAIVFAASVAAWDGVRLERGDDYASVRVKSYRYALILATVYVIVSVVLAARAAA
ncbi:MAG: hypothetical protein ACR2JI_06000 [Mycobacterium sp.]